MGLAVTHIHSWNCCWAIWLIYRGLLDSYDCGNRATNLDLCSSKACQESAVLCILVENLYFAVALWEVCHLVKVFWFFPFSVIDRWLNCQKKKSSSNFVSECGEKTSWTSNGSSGDSMQNLSCRNCPRSLWDTVHMQEFQISPTRVECTPSPKEKATLCD